MGMDVYGKSPASETGEYFRRSVWGWRPLADFILANASEEADACQYWHSNDADGLGAEDAVCLADKLDQLVADGSAADWVRLRDASLEALPDTPCELCGCTGCRKDEVGVKLGFTARLVEAVDGDGRPNPRAGETGWCNGCSGRGTKRPHATHYHLEVSDISEFAAFCRASGGFEIC